MPVGETTATVFRAIGAGVRRAIATRRVMRCGNVYRTGDLSVSSAKLASWFLPSAVRHVGP